MIAAKLKSLVKLKQMTYTKMTRTMHSLFSLSLFLCDMQYSVLEK